MTEDYTMNNQDTVMAADAGEEEAIDAEDGTDAEATAAAVAVVEPAKTGTPT